MSQINNNNDNEYYTGHLPPEIEYGSPPDSYGNPAGTSGSPAGEQRQTAAAKKNSRKRKARIRRRRARLVLLAVLLILIVFSGKMIYDRHAVPSTPEAYMECLEAEQYEKCASIAKKMAGDSDFVGTIGKPIQKEASTAFSRYAAGETDSASTLERLESLNKASAGLFADSINSQIASVRELDDLYNSISSVSDLVKQGRMEGLEEAYEILAGAKEKGEALGTNPDWMLESVIRDNIAGLKYYLFSRYADELQLGRSGYAFIEESAAFINTYAEDPDLNNYLSIMSDLQKGWHSPIYAEDAARTAAAAAEKEWREAIAD